MCSVAESVCYLGTEDLISGGMLLGGRDTIFKTLVFSSSSSGNQYRLQDQVWSAYPVVILILEGIKKQVATSHGPTPKSNIGWPQTLHIASIQGDSPGGNGLPLSIPPPLYN